MAKSKRWLRCNCATNLRVATTALGQPCKVRMRQVVAGRPHGVDLLGKFVLRTLVIHVCARSATWADAG